MGQDKALLELAGKPLIQHAVEKLRLLCTEVWILGDRQDLAAYAPCLPDKHPGCGPLGALETALAYTPFEWNLFLPVDAPLVPLAWLQHLLQRASTSGALAVISQEEATAHPLCAAYHRNLHPGMQQALAMGERKVTVALDNVIEQIARKRRCPVESLLLSLSPAAEGNWLESLSVEQRAGSHLWFLNLNTPEDLQMTKAHPELLKGPL
jgi:molybdopterin-guanine dinucleotide biosynthesis protein A